MEEELKLSSTETAYTIIARAIRKHFDGDEEKMKVPWSRQMAQIIDDGFLDGLLGQAEALIAHNEKIARQAEAESRSILHQLRYEKRVLEEKVRDLKDEQQMLQRQIDLTKEEPDQALAGAKKAYEWIYQRTRDKELASKAFNSYLIGKGKRSDIEDELKGETE